MRVITAHFRFSLLALFVVVTLSCILLTWSVLSSPVFVRTRLRIRPDPVAITGESEGLNAQQLADFRRSILADIRSDRLLITSLRDPRISGLAPIQGTSDPDAWLRRNLIIELPDDSEFLILSLKTSDEEKSDSALLLDTVAKKLVELELYNDRAGRMVQSQLKLHAAEVMKDAITRRESKVAGRIKLSDVSSTASDLAEEESKTRHEELHSMLKAAERIELNVSAVQPVVILEPASADSARF